MEQEPQRETVVLVLVSQPGEEVQSPKPELQAKPQVVPLQVGVEFRRVGQLVVQLPHFVGRLSAASQPLLVLLSQLPKPVTQLENTHVPVAHEAFALGNEQVLPQVPQLLRLLSAVSQPLLALESQLPKPLVQAPIPQVPVVQVGVAFDALQALPQKPQFCREVCRFVSQVEALPSQSPFGAVHDETPQTPALQIGVPPEAGQALPHVPQFFGSCCTLVSQPLFATESQLSKPALHWANWQVPVEHEAVALAMAHTLPQEPQSVSVLSDASQPVAGLLSQSPKPELQAPMPHCPATQVPAAFNGLQALPQNPQFWTEVWRFVSQLAGVPLQSAVGAGQFEVPQTPAVQVALPPPLAHCLEQAPQLLGSWATLVSHPFLPSPSQSSKPVGQLPLPSPFASFPESAPPVAPASPALAAVPPLPPPARLSSAVSEQDMIQTPAQSAAAPSERSERIMACDL